MKNKALQSTFIVVLFSLVAYYVMKKLTANAAIIAEQFLKQYEGCSLSAYQESINGKKDVPTIGYGTIQYENGIAVRMGDTITQARADELLLWELNTKLNAVSAKLKVKQSNNQLAALTSFAYNVGLTNFYNSSLLGAINAGYSADDITTDFMKWVYFNHEVSNGLVNRRKAEVKLYFS